MTTVSSCGLVYKEQQMSGFCILLPLLFSLTALSAPLDCTHLHLIYPSVSNKRPALWVQLRQFVPSRSLVIMWQCLEICSWLFLVLVSYFSIWALINLCIHSSSRHTRVLRLPAISCLGILHSLTIFHPLCFFTLKSSVAWICVSQSHPALQL